jgi:hypothetical protein
VPIAPIKGGRIEANFSGAIFLQMVKPSPRAKFMERPRSAQSQRLPDSVAEDFTVFELLKPESSRCER